MRYLTRATAVAAISCGLLSSPALLTEAKAQPNCTASIDPLEWRCASNVPAWGAASGKKEDFVRCYAETKESLTTGEDWKCHIWRYDAPKGQAFCKVAGGFLNRIPNNNDYIQWDHNADRNRASQSLTVAMRPFGGTTRATTRMVFRTVQADIDPKAAGCDILK